MFNIPTVILFSGFNTFGSGINVMHNNTNEIKNGEIINDQKNNKTIIFVIRMIKVDYHNLHY